MIRISCSCGKTLSAPPTLAGRRVKCPKCAASLVVPAAEPPPPAAEENPFALDGAETAKPQRGLYEARRLAKYWRKQNGGVGGGETPDPENLPKLPKTLRDLGPPEAIFRAGATPSTARVVGGCMLAPIFFAALAVAIIALGTPQGQREIPEIGYGALPIAVLSLVGWILLARSGKKADRKLALLYPDGFALVNGTERSYHRWPEIEEVELRPENKSGGTVIFFGHTFIIKTKDEEQVSIGMEYFGVVELGLVIMERAVPEGATCTGYADIPK